MKKLSLIFSRNSLLIIYKTFVMSILDYTDLIYDRPFTDSFKNKLEILMCKLLLLLLVQSKTHVFNRELGFESFAERRWSRKIHNLHKMINGLLPVYLQIYISYGGEGVYRTRPANQNNLIKFSTKKLRVIFYFLLHERVE